MTKQIAFILIVALRLAYQPTHDQQGLSPFASNLHSSEFSLSPAGLSTEAGASERLILKWMIGDNRPANCLRTVKEFYEYQDNLDRAQPIQLMKDNSMSKI